MTRVKTKDIVEEYIAEFERWETSLKPYIQDRFDRNYRQYTAYTETKGTETKISDPTAPELIEKAVTRYFERDPKFFILSRGHKVPKQIERLVAATAEYIWSNPEVIQSTGTSRSKLKKIGREFSIIGNAGTETFYNLEAECPDFRHIPIEDVIFDPSKTLKSSKVYYIRNRVDLNFLKENAEITKGGEVVKGTFKNIDQIEKIYEGVNEKSESPLIERRGRNSVDEKVGPITLITRYEGNKVCRFIKDLPKDNEGGIVIQEFKNEVLGDDPLDFAMDIELPKVPYAFSFLDFINGLIAAKDLLLNQIIDYGAKQLNPPLFADPSLGPLSKATLANAWRLGGLVFANPQQVDHKAMPALSNTPFQLLNYLGARNEQVSSIGSYLGGVPNQESDKTQGTLGGIQTMLQQAIGPVRDRQQNIEESIVEPVINKMLKMAGALMGKDEIKYVLLSGQSPEWVKVTRGLLTGEMTVTDLVKSEVIDEQTGLEIAELILAKGGNPDEFVLFKTDWLVRVETGSMAEVDSEQEIKNLKEWVAFNLSVGQPLNMKAVSEELAIRSKIKEPERFFAEMMPGMPGAMPGMPGAMPPQPGMMPQGAPNAAQPV